MVLGFDYYDIVQHCPYSSNLQCKIYGDCTGYICERKQAYYYTLQTQKLNRKLEEIKEYANQLEVFTHIKEDLLNIIKGAEDE